VTRGYHLPFRRAARHGWAQPELNSFPLLVRPVRASSLGGAIALEEALYQRREPMTQTQERREQTRMPELPVDFFWVETSSMCWFVSREMARAVEMTLTRKLLPRWVTFVDLTGARVRVRTRLIEVVSQSTAEQRVMARAFQRARSAERKAEADWDGD